jgi:hypothetical protein
VTSAADLKAWCRGLVHGAGGLRAYFAREVKRRATLDDAVAFTIRSLANPRCEGSAEVLRLILAQRERAGG